MCLMWTWSSSVLLLGGIFLQTVTSIPYHGRSAGIPYAQSSHTVDLQIIPAIAVPQSPSAPHSTQSVFPIDASLDKHTPLLALHGGYGMFIHIANQAVILKLETASSDTWVADSYFNCVDLYGTTHPQSYCQTGPTVSSNTGCRASEIKDVHFNVQYADYSGASGPMAILPLRIADNITVNQQIGIARNVVTLFGRDNITSGVLGLAYSSLTSSYEGTDIWATEECLTDSAIDSHESGVSQPDQKKCDRRTYASVSETLFPPNSTNTRNSTGPMKQKVFSLSLSRSTVGNLYGGSIAFGGVSDVTSPYINASGPFVDVPNEPFGNDPSGELGYYVVSVEGIVLPMDAGTSVGNTSISTDLHENGLLQSTVSVQRRRIASRPRDTVVRRSPQPMHKDKLTRINADNHNPKDATSIDTNTEPQSHPRSKTLTLPTTPRTSQFIIDSSCPFSYLPHHLAKAYNSLFQPPAYRLYHGGPYLLNCSALTYISPLGLTIGGETFWHNTADLVVRAGIVDVDGDGEVCYSAVQEAVGTDSHGDKGKESVDGNASSGDEEGQARGDAEEVNAKLILGQPFLKNVLAVFDIGNGRIGLMSRVDYETSM